MGLDLGTNKLFRAIGNIQKRNTTDQASECSVLLCMCRKSHTEDALNERNSDQESMAENENWETRIETAYYDSGFTPKDREDARDWNTCALSENPRHQIAKSEGRFNSVVEEWKFLTKETRKLGVAFTEAVNGDNYDDAEELYEKIVCLDPIYNKKPSV